jgi:hypothetical protein
MIYWQCKKTMHKNLLLNISDNRFTTDSFKFVNYSKRISVLLIFILRLTFLITNHKIVRWVLSTITCHYPHVNSYCPVIISNRHSMYKNNPPIQSIWELIIDLFLSNCRIKSSIKNYLLSINILHVNSTKTKQLTSWKKNLPCTYYS